MVRATLSMPGAPYCLVSATTATMRIPIDSHSPPRLVHTTIATTRIAILLQAQRSL